METINEEMIAEAIIEESENIKKCSLSKETDKYYNFITKKLAKLESKSSDKKDFNSSYYILKSKATELKRISDKAKKIEGAFNAADDKEQKIKVLKSYKQLAKDASSILKESKKEVNKIKNLLIKGGMTAAAVAAAFAIFKGYDEYMDSFTRKLNVLLHPQNSNKLLNKITGAILYNTKGPGWIVPSVNTDLKEEFTYFNY